MNSSRIDQKPSETALFAALRRTIAYKEYHNARFGPDHLAEIFLPPHFRFFLKFNKVRENTRLKLARFIPGMNEYIIARTAYFDRQFTSALSNQTPQIVLLGAGYNSRPYRFTRQNKGTTIYELDAPPTQARKVKALQAAHIDIPKQVKFVPINFLNDSLGGVLEKAGYQRDAQTLFLWEGVSYYLDLVSVKRTLGYVAHASRNSVIAFDYAVSIAEQDVDKVFGAREFMKSMGEQHANEALLFSLKQDEIGSFLADNSLCMMEHLDNSEIEQRYLVDDNGSLIGRITGNFRFVTATPVKDDRKKTNLEVD